MSALIAELKQRAKTCETASQDLTEAALTGGETSDKEKNTQDTNEWMIRSKVWLEAEAVVRGFLPPAALNDAGGEPVLFPCEPVPAPLRPAPCS